jgi:RNA polymerase sigma factor (sigma-70 family)
MYQDSDRRGELLFLEHVSWISRVAQKTAAQHGLFGEEVSDFESVLKMKIMEDDYAIIRNFKGESSLKTYLSVVVSRHFLDYWRETRGRGRPSATARRLGPLAVRLEKLVYRDGYSASQAIARLQTEEANIPEERELLRLLDQLPKRETLQPEEAYFDRLSGHSEGVATQVSESGTEQQRERLHSTLERALASLSEEDRVIVRLNLIEGVSLADVARVLRIEQKPLYRRITRLREALRQRLKEEGVDVPMVRSALPSDMDP